MEAPRRDPMIDANPMDRLSREQWATAVAAVMSWLPLPAIDAIVAGGEARFFTEAGPILQGHAFKRSDLRLIFNVLCEVAKTRSRINPRELLTSLSG